MPRTRSRVAEKPVHANAYTIIAPNAGFEGYLFDGKVRFIEGKARITDAIAKRCGYRDGISNGLVMFENAEQCARYLIALFKEQRSDLDGQVDRPGYRCHPPLPPLPAAEPDEFNPNLGRSPRDRVRAQRVMDVPPPPGVPAGADPDKTFAPRNRQKQKEAITSGG